MSKTHKELTPVEALKRLAEAGKPIRKGLWFKDRDDDGWQVRTLLGVQFTHTQFLTEFDDDTLAFDQCAELVEEAPKPWTFDTCPRERCWLRRSVGGEVEYLLSSVRQTSVAASGYGDIGWQTLASEWQHSLDNGKTWLPCTQ